MNDEEDMVEVIHLNDGSDKNYCVMVMTETLISYYYFDTKLQASAYLHLSGALFDLKGQKAEIKLFERNSVSNAMRDSRGELINLN